MSGVRISDVAIRQGAFDFLALHCRDPESTISWQLLTNGYSVDGDRVPLIGASGIWKPGVLSLPISLTTAPIKPGQKRPYDDAVSDDGLLHYKYQGEDPNNHWNVGVRECYRNNVPLIYFHGVAKGVYLPTWPVFVVADDPTSLTFTVAIEDVAVLRPDLTPATVDEAKRRYYTTVTRRRLHQATFRDRVLTAYRKQCSICSLRHTELLEAAHIIPDKADDGIPVVSNGLSLCKIHHAAYDHNILGIRPDYQVEIRNDLLVEIDGPMLKHGIQEFHGKGLLLPKRPEDQPSTERLEKRYEEFRAAS